jgi:hypothetical protein
MAAIGPFVESLLPNYLATFLPSGEIIGSIVTIWAFLAFFVIRWCWRRTRGQPKVILPVTLIVVSLFGLLGGAIWLAKIMPAVTLSKAAEQSKPAFDIGGAGNIAASDIKLCGEMTVVRSQPGSTGSLDLKGFTGIAPNTKCSFPPPTEATKGLSNKELKQRVAALCEALDGLQKSIEDQRSIRLNDQQRRALDQQKQEEFKSRYLEQAMELNNAVAARIGWVDIPESKPNEKNVMKAQMWATITQHGRATLIFGKPIGLDPVMGVSNYLTFITENLPQ